MYDATGPLYQGTVEDTDPKTFAMLQLRNGIHHVDPARKDVHAEAVRMHNARLERAIDWIESQPEPAGSKWR